MNRVRFRFLCALLAGSLAGSAPAAVFVWTGFGNGWLDQSVPPNDGTADLFFGPALRTNVTFTSSFSADAIVLASNENYFLGAPSAVTLSLASGIFSVATDFNRSQIDANINVGISGSPLFDIGTSQLIVNGHITGSVSTLSLFASNFLNGVFIFNNPGTGNTYTGNTLIGSAAGMPAVAFWNSSPFGTGNVTLYDGGQLIAHNTVTVANNFILNAGGNSNVLLLRSWDAPLTLSGAVTLANNTTIQTQPAFQGVVATDNTGILPLPGPFTRFPTIVTGNVGETGGARTLTISGQGLLILKPTAGSNTYTGGTVVNGPVIFGTPGAVPSTGLVRSNFGGYVGLAGTAIASPGDFANFLGSRADRTVNVGGVIGSSGAFGVDTLPGNSTVTFSDTINLTGFSNTNVRLGTATAAILTGSIIPKGPNYQFGNGGGDLFVQTNLANVSDVTANPTGAPSLLSVGGSGLVQKVFLQGSNTYAGGTNVSSGVLVFDSGSAIPVTGQLVAAGTNATIGASYIGYTDSVVLASAFTTKFGTPTNTWGIIGFDTHAGNPTATINGAVDLSGFNNGVYIGTATSAILTGTLSPSTVSNPNFPTTAGLLYAPNTLRFTAANGGTLTINSNLTGSLGVVLGSPSGNHVYSSGTTVLGGTNTYSGGTLLIPSAGGLTVSVASSGAFGTGAVTIGDYGGRVGLQAAGAGINLPNNVTMSTVAGPALNLTGINPFTLSGSISGNGYISLVNPAPLTVTLSGNNSGFSGILNVYNGTLNLAHNNAAGTAMLDFGSPAATIAFTGGATAPVLYALNGDAGNLVVPNGTTLTVDTSDSDANHEFLGLISGPAGATTTASLVVTSSNPSGDGLYLGGDNRYTGGTTIVGNGVLGLGHDNSAGLGPVVVNSTFGGLVLNSGVTFTNNLTFTQGGLAGFGTFAPANLGSITFDTGRFVMPGFDGAGLASGALTLATDVVFANGGEFLVNLVDPSTIDGVSRLFVSGNLNITANTGGFLIGVRTFDAEGNLGFANLTVGTPYSLPILQTTGSITGFSPSEFIFNATGFQAGTLSLTNFSLSIDGDNQNLYLNFTPIPEPSTVACLLAGMGGLGLATWRRRRQRAGNRHGLQLKASCIKDA